MCMEKFAKQAMAEGVIHREEASSCSISAVLTFINIHNFSNLIIYTPNITSAGDHYGFGTFQAVEPTLQ
jgi:hypothetical protein